MNVADFFNGRLPGVLGVRPGRGFSLGETATLPPAAANRRGEMRRVEGGTGIADRFVAERKNGGDAYEWADIPTLVGAAKGVLPVFNVKDYGAKGDDATDDTTAIVSRAVAAAIAAGGGTIYFPPGTYVVANGGSATGVPLHGDNLRLIGAGKELTTLTIADSANDHVIQVIGNDCEIAHLTINGNRANQSSQVHGIRMEGERHHVHDCIIEEMAHYGLGLGQGLATDLRHSLFENLMIRNTGGDGIDLKNRQSNNVGNRFSNIIIENYDLAGNTAQAGLDIRGHATVNNLWVYTTTAPESGCHLRFRDDITTTGSASNCHLEAGTTGVGDITIAVTTGANAADVALSNIYAVGFSRAYAISGPRTALTNCRSLDADDVGFYFRDALGQRAVNCAAVGASTGFNLEQDGVRLIGCLAEDCTTSGVRIAGDDNILADCSFDAASGNGVLLVTGAEDTYIHDCDFRANGGTDISDVGTRTIAVRNLGASAIGTTESLVIASGQITITDGFKALILVDTEGAAATDDLTGISGGEVGQYITVRSVSSARDVTVTDVGNLRLSAAMLLDNIPDTLTLICVGAGVWQEIGRSNNA